MKTTIIKLVLSLLSLIGYFFFSRMLDKKDKEAVVKEEKDLETGDKQATIRENAKESDEIKEDSGKIDDFLKGENK